MRLQEWADLLCQILMVFTIQEVVYLTLLHVKTNIDPLHCSLEVAVGVVNKSMVVIYIFFFLLSLFADALSRWWWCLVISLENKHAVFRYRVKWAMGVVHISDRSYFIFQNVWFFTRLCIFKWKFHAFSREKQMNATVKMHALCILFYFFKSYV